MVMPLTRTCRKCRKTFLTPDYIPMADRCPDCIPTQVEQQVKMALAIVDDLVDLPLEDTGVLRGEPGREFLADQYEDLAMSLMHFSLDEMTQFRANVKKLRADVRVLKGLAP